MQLQIYDMMCSRKIRHLCEALNQADQLDAGAEVRREVGDWVDGRCESKIAARRKVAVDPGV